MICCPICYEYKENIIKLNCNHIFCTLCINKWYKTYLSIQDPLTEETIIDADLNVPCPICRTKSNDEIWDIVINDYILN